VLGMCFPPVLNMCVPQGRGHMYVLGMCFPPVLTIN